MQAKWYSVLWNKDCMDHSKRMFMSQHLVILILNYSDQEAMDKTKYREKEWFPRHNVVIVNPYLFNTYIRELVGLDSGERGMKIGGRHINNFTAVTPYYWQKTIMMKIKENSKEGLSLNIKKRQEVQYDYRRIMQL